MNLKSMKTSMSGNIIAQMIYAIEEKLKWNIRSMIANKIKIPSEIDMRRPMYEAIKEIFKN